MEPDECNRSCGRTGDDCCASVETIIVIVALLLGLPMLCWLGCYCSVPYNRRVGRENQSRERKSDQENLEVTERQDQVIKTYQIAKMIVSGTAFESLQLTVLQTRLHFALDISVNIS